MLMYYEVLTEEGNMKYVSKLHVTVKMRYKRGLFSFIGKILERVLWQKVEVVFTCKGGARVYAKVQRGRDVPITGRIGKVQTVEFVTPWDCLLFAMVRYRGNIKEEIRIANGAEVQRYGNCGGGSGGGKYRSGRNGRGRV